MRIAFDILAVPTELWTMDINQIRRFALTLVDDPLSGFQSQAAVINHSASFAITPGPSGGLLFPIVASEDTGALFGDLHLPVNVNIPDVVNGTGPVSVQLDFEQRLVANSFATSNVAGGQEAAVRFGMTGSLSDVTADDYPGFGSRVLNDDGHFVDVKLTFVVPEPSTFVLAAFGLLIAGLRARGWRKRS